jgi:hypothetical protein
MLEGTEIHKIKDYEKELGQELVLLFVNEMNSSVSSK